MYLVPTAMNYDALLEEGSLAAQLAGAAKKGESLAGLARCALKCGGEEGPGAKRPMCVWGGGAPGGQA